jgi:type IV pilus assembly protein PilA
MIEILIVVAIILIVAAIAIPSLLRSKMAANEGAAVSNTRTIATSEAAYWNEFGVGYSPTLLALGPPSGNTPPNPTAADLIDGTLAAGTRSGYLYIYAPGPVDNGGRINTFTLNVNPVAVNVTGFRYFFMDESGVIRQNTAGPASVTDPPVQ